MPDIETEDALPGEAKRAWLAYQSMHESKHTYFNLLQELDEKYSSGGAPSIAESLKLEELLAVHDQRVKAFNLAMQEVTDKKARTALLEKFS